MGHLDDSLLTEFSYTISEKTFAFFTDHRAGPKYYSHCFLQKRIGKDAVHKFTGDDKFMPSDEQEERDRVLLVL